MEGIIIVVILAILSIVGTYILRKIKSNKMVECIKKGDIKAFEKESNSLLTKCLFSAFNVLYLRLNAYVLAGNEKKINETFALLLKMRKNKSQTEDVTMKAFNYYIGVEDKKRCKELLDKINTFNNVRMKEEAEMMYNIFILKNDKYVAEMEESLDGLPDARKAITEYLLSVQYANRGDKKKAKEYEGLSKIHMKQPLPETKKK